MRLISFVGFLLWCLNSVGANYTLQLKKGCNGSYESLTGIIVVVRESCQIPDYSEGILQFFDNDSLENKFYFQVEESFIVAPETCEGEFGGCETSELFVPFISTREVTKFCPVFGVLGLPKSLKTAEISSSRVIYSMDDKTLRLYDIEIWKELIKTINTLKYAKLGMTPEGLFKILEIK